MLLPGLLAADGLLGQPLWGSAAQMRSQAMDAAAYEQLWELQRKKAAEQRFGHPEQGGCTVLLSAPANMCWGNSMKCCLVQSPAVISQ